jgi:serine protease
MKVARRSVLTDRSLVVQSDARMQMLDAMDKYGLAGQVEISRGGQMVIQLGDLGGAPNQLTDGAIKRFDRPVMAFQSKMGCPDDIAPEMVRQDAALATECVVQSLRESGDFEYVEKDFIFTNQFARKPHDLPETVNTTPTDPLWGMQWNFQSNGDGEGQSPGGAGFTDFWSAQANQGSKNVVVAVVDTGLQLSHPDIKDSPNVAPGWDMVSDPSMGNDGDGRDSDANDPGDLCDPDVPFAENSFHGTHVAGTIGAAATNNGAGVAGGAWNVTIVPVRALGKCGGRLSDINDAIRWAGGLVPAIDTDGSEAWNENPADIINLSIGLFEYCPASLQDAIDAVSERGVIVVAAAGNARISTKYYAPGGCNNVISVAAGDARGQIAPYSNYGAEVDVLAPGGDLTRDDDGDGRPDGILSTK